MLLPALRIIRFRFASGRFKYELRLTVQIVVLNSLQGLLGFEIIPAFRLLLHNSITEPKFEPNIGYSQSNLSSPYFLFR